MSNKYRWETYEIPQAPSKEPKDDNKKKEIMVSHPETFTIRYLKQGATGAVKTWPAAEVLLEYLVRRGGLRNIGEKLAHNSTTKDSGILNLIHPPSLDSLLPPCTANSKTFNIVELGGGSGYLSVGLSLSLSKAYCRSSVKPRVRLMCTDNDNATIKNMRHNVARQPPNSKTNKMVRVQPLEWGPNIGEEKFSSAVRSHFQQKSNLPDESQMSEEEDDPICLISHLIASDVHYGGTTLGPLSSVISAIKVRNPRVVVIILLRERTANAVAELKEQIEEKVKIRLDSDEQQTATAADLEGFSLTVRDVLHSKIPNLKLVEC